MVPELVLKILLIRLNWEIRTPEWRAIFFAKQKTKRGKLFLKKSIFSSEKPKNGISREKRTVKVVTDNHHLSYRPSRRMRLSLPPLPKESVADDLKSGEFQFNWLMFGPKFRLLSMHAQVL